MQYYKIALFLGKQSNTAYTNIKKSKATTESIKSSRLYKYLNEKLDVAQLVACEKSGTANSLCIPENPILGYSSVTHPLEADCTLLIY